MRDKILYLVWYPHARRAETLAGELNAELVFIYEAQLKRKWLKPLRYLAQGWKTWRLLERERPSVVIAQSPPIFAPLTAALWCRLRGRKRTAYIIDCHPGSFYDPNWHWALPLLRRLARGALVSLLCNEDAQDIMLQWQASNIFLPDGLPDLTSASGVVGADGNARIAVISTFSADEPIANVFAAARLLPGVTFYVTGDPKRAPNELLAQKAENVILTGFLKGSVYNGLLHNVHGIMVLSTTRNTLSCGAFEALSLEKPTVVSDLPEMRRCFTRGFIHVTNTPEAIARGVEQLLDERTTLAAEVGLMREEYSSSRRPKLEALVALLGREPAARAGASPAPTL